MLRSLFPTAHLLRFGHIDINADASAYCFHKGAVPAFNTPAVQAEIVAFAHQKRDLDASYGGWLEIRATIFQYTYLAERSAYLHLGVDFNVPAGTHVASPWSGTVLLVDNDTPEVGGWGERVVLALDDRDEAVIFAHLGPKAMVKQGERVRVGQPLGLVGSPDENGGWYPHLHLQRMLGRVWRSFYPDRLGWLDGYGQLDHMTELAIAFPDPLALLLTP